ncbi:MAG TPA: AIR synthase family protein [Flavobacterium sp.]|nr:AIR synthase family protein [Flavobacterium sp.]
MNRQTGKIDDDFFARIFQDQFGKLNREVCVMPQFGVDVSVINLSEQWDLAVASDPLSLIPQLGLQESAWLSVQLTANDIATTGFAPQFGQFVLNLPLYLSHDDLTTYWKHIHLYCKDIGLAITGGHTGFTEGQNSTIAGSATFFTKALKDDFLTTKNAKKGDKILVTKNCALSTTAILAMSFPETVKNKIGVEKHEKACQSFYQTSVLKDALIAVDNGNKKYINAMHDVTEGGVLGAIYELAKASGNGAMVEDDKLPVTSVQKAVCELFSLNPSECIGAGAMIISCKEEGVDKIISDLKKEGIPCTEVGELTDKSFGFYLIKNQKKVPWNYQTNDPYWVAFYNAIKAGWK